MTKDILKAELLGCNCTIADSPNRPLVGLSGRIIDETQNTIVIQTKERNRRIMKKGSIFIITIKDKKYQIKGDLINFRPEDRIKKIR
jgi:ribonuclease P protein subunit POP4